MKVLDYDKIDGLLGLEYNGEEIDTFQALEKQVVQAIPLDEVKQAINKVSQLRLESGIKGNIVDDEIYIDSMVVLNILDKLIAESEG